MMQNELWSALLLLPLFLLGGEAQEKISDEVFRERFTPEADARAERFATAIAAELEGDELPAWAGTYYMGDGLGKNVSVSLAPESGFHFTWNGCVGIYDRNFGAVQARDGRLHLACEFPNSRRALQGVAPELLPLAWGGRTYLLDASDVMDFVNDVNEGDEPRPEYHGRHLMRRGDENKPTVGKPQLPEEWASALLDEPITAKVLTVEVRPDERPKLYFREHVYVVLDVGSEQGVRQGMRFIALEDKSRARGRVMELEAERCKVRIWNLDQDDPLPEVAQRFATRR